MSAQARWQSFCERRDRAVARAGRTPANIQVLAVTKTQPAEVIAAHLREVPGFPCDLGENYLQELVSKVDDPAWGDLQLRWHFIGNLQSRKIAEVCRIAETIHSVGRLKELELLSQVRSRAGSIPNFFLQFNTSGEGSKNGFDPSELNLAKETLERLNLQGFFAGLMCSATPLGEASEIEVRACFAGLRKLRDLSFAGAKLNMGMSADFEWAIEEGSDLIRVGTLLFGERLLN